MTTCPGCGAELVVGLERTEEDRLREVVRSELAMQPPVVVHDTIEVPVPAPVDPAAEAVDELSDEVAEAVDELSDEVDELADELAADGAEGELADELADELAALDEDEPEPAPTPPSDDAPSRGHFLGRKVFG